MFTVETTRHAPSNKQNKNIFYAMLKIGWHSVVAGCFIFVIGECLLKWSFKIFVFLLYPKLVLPNSSLKSEIVEWSKNRSQNGPKLRIFQNSNKGEIQLNSSVSSVQPHFFIHNVRIHLKFTWHNPLPVPHITHTQCHLINSIR